MKNRDTKDKHPAAGQGADLPYSLVNHNPEHQRHDIFDAAGRKIAGLGSAQAAFIVRACNSHAPLVAALNALEDSISAWEDEEDSVQEEHAELIASLNRSAVAARAAIKSAK